MPMNGKGRNTTPSVDYCQRILKILRATQSNSMARNKLEARLLSHGRSSKEAGTVKQGIDLALQVLYPFVQARGADLVLADSLQALTMQRGSEYYERRKTVGAKGKQAVAAHIHDNYLNSLDAVFMDAGKGRFFSGSVRHADNVLGKFTAHPAIVHVS